MDEPHRRDILGEGWQPQEPARFSNGAGRQVGERHAAFLDDLEQAWSQRMAQIPEASAGFDLDDFHDTHRGPLAVVDAVGDGVRISTDVEVARRISIVGLCLWALVAFVWLVPWERWL